ncbi:hypothetical protein VIGAN_07171100, partial [Vigna angularis var. angularis]
MKHGKEKTAATLRGENVPATSWKSHGPGPAELEEEATAASKHPATEEELKGERSHREDESKDVTAADPAVLRKHTAMAGIQLKRRSMSNPAKQEATENG